MMKRRFVGIVLALTTVASAHAESLILTGQAANLSKFLGITSKRVGVQPLFTEIEQRTLTKLGKTDMAATLLVQPGTLAA